MEMFLASSGALVCMKQTAIPETINPTESESISSIKVKAESVRVLIFLVCRLISVSHRLVPENSNGGALPSRAE